MPTDFESEIAGTIIDLEGVPAVFEDAEGVQSDVRVLFWEGHADLSALGIAIDATGPVAAVGRSSLLDARKGCFLTVAGRKYAIPKSPEDDGRVFRTIKLEGPVG